MCIPVNKVNSVLRLMFIVLDDTIVHNFYVLFYQSIDTYTLN
jgi:hypothetical protein